MGCADGGGPVRVAASGHPLFLLRRLLCVVDDRSGEGIAANGMAVRRRSHRLVELSELYRIAPLGDKPAHRLKRAYANSMFKCFVLDDGRLVGAGRAVADGVDCAYLCDIV